MKSAGKIHHKLKVGRSMIRKVRIETLRMIVSRCKG